MSRLFTFIRSSLSGLWAAFRAKRLDPEPVAPPLFMAAIAGWPATSPRSSATAAILPFHCMPRALLGRRSLMVAMLKAQPRAEPHQARIAEEVGIQLCGFEELLLLRRVVLALPRRVVEEVRRLRAARRGVDGVRVLPICQVFHQDVRLDVLAAADAEPLARLEVHRGRPGPVARVDLTGGRREYG